MSAYAKETRKTAARNLVKKCEVCGKQIERGRVFYDLTVYCKDEDGIFLKSNGRCCAKCKHKRERRAGRLLKCPHNKTAMHYRYIRGEAVMEPDYEYCLVCGKVKDEGGHQWMT